MHYKDSEFLSLEISEWIIYRTFYFPIKTYAEWCSFYSRPKIYSVRPGWYVF